MSNILLLITATIWGFAFVAQRVGSQYVGAFTFNGIRFAIGSISLIPLIIYLNKRRERNSNTIISSKKILVPGIIIGITVYASSTFQQMGINYTTAGKASFITGLYMIIVPIIGLFLGHRIGKNSWIGIVFAIIGLYFLSVNDYLIMSYGDILEVFAAVFAAIHILTIDHYSKRFDSLILSFVQFATCSILSFISAFFLETTNVYNILSALIPILYGGFLSVGVAYTIQVIAQKNAKASHAGVILSMESVFGAIGGELILGESMNTRGYVGCFLIITGIILSQIKFSLKKQQIKSSY